MNIKLVIDGISFDTGELQQLRKSEVVAYLEDLLWRISEGDYDDEFEEEDA